MDGIGAVCVCFWIELLTEFVPMIAGATVVETVEAKAAVIVSKYRRITIAMRTIKGTLFKLVFCAGTYGDLLQDLHGMICQKLLKVECLSVALLRILRSDTMSRRTFAMFCTSAMDVSLTGLG